MVGVVVPDQAAGKKWRLGGCSGLWKGLQDLATDLLDSLGRNVL
jgi:hypothetical protein